MCVQATNHRRRIIQTSLLAEYAYLLAVGGMLYTISDVQASMQGCSTGICMYYYNLLSW